METDELIRYLRSYGRALVYKGHLDNALLAHFDDHQKTVVSIADRSAEIDNDLVPLITSLWEQGCETTASCQEVEDSKAYVQFLSAETGADRIQGALNDSEVPCERRTTNVPVQLGFGMTLQYTLEMIVFPRSEIGKVTQIVQQGLSS